MASWTAVTHAGAFVVGAVLATIATLRVMRAIGGYFAGVDRERRRWRADPGRDD